jgi:hypothetical protein
LRSIFYISKAPSDTTIRSYIDKVDKNELKKVFTPFIEELDNQGILRSYTCLDDYLYVPIDGTQYFTSQKVNCSCCLEQHHGNGTITYSHKALCACIVHPKQEAVFPIAIEDISKQDGATKNDCETNAAKRLIPQIVERLPQNKNILLGGDALYATGPMIKLIEQLDAQYSNDIRFIFNVKPGSHAYLFLQVERLDKEGKVKIHTRQTKTKKYVTKYYNQLMLNGKNQHILVDFILFEEQNLKTGKVKTFSWVTNIRVTSSNLLALVAIGRSRWKIENETFNTLKNHGYEFKHNFGHGKKNLAANFATLMLLAFLFDQIQMATCSIFRRAKNNMFTFKDFWAEIRSIFDKFEVQSMEFIYKIIARVIKMKVQFII